MPRAYGQTHRYVAVSEPRPRVPPLPRQRAPSCPGLRLLSTAVAKGSCPSDPLGHYSQLSANTPRLCSLRPRVPPFKPGPDPARPPLQSHTGPVRTPESPLPSHFTALTGPAACCGLWHHQLGNTAPSQGRPRATASAGVPRAPNPNTNTAAPSVCSLLWAQARRASQSTRFCEGQGSHNSHPGRWCQSQVTGCGAAGTRTGHAQVPGRKHSTLAHLPPQRSLAGDRQSWPQAAIFTLQWSQPPEKNVSSDRKEKFRVTQCQPPRHCLSQASLIGSPDAHCPGTLNQPEANTGPTETQNTSPPHCGKRLDELASLLLCSVCLHCPSRWESMAATSPSNRNTPPPSAPSRGLHPVAGAEAR